MSNRNMNPELEGEDLFGEMQSTPLPRNNPSDNEEEEQDSVAVINPVASATFASVWKPKSPIMGGESFKLVKMITCHTLVANLTHYGLD